MQQLKVIINDVAVYIEQVQDYQSMIRAHYLRKLFCIDILKLNEIKAGVYVNRGNDFLEAREVRIDDNAYVVSSKMNDADFVEEPEWFDDQFPQK